MAEAGILSEDDRGEFIEGRNYHDESHRESPRRLCDAIEYARSFKDRSVRQPS
ncbi:MAG TPA: hypothetical protein VNM72_12120 [Blastocatellia bacterium]|nr:hypothetical protein [Blastocatellia bacterium]